MPIPRAPVSGGQRTLTQVWSKQLAHSQIPTDRQLFISLPPSTERTHPPCTVGYRTQTPAGGEITECCHRSILRPLLTPPHRGNSVKEQVFTWSIKKRQHNSPHPLDHLPKSLNLSICAFFFIPQNFFLCIHQYNSFLYFIITHYISEGS